MPIMDIDSTVTLAQPFNPPKVEELTTAALIAGGYTFPPLMPVSVSEGNTLLNVQVESGTYNQTQIDDIVSILNVVCVDPTRNNLTEEQQEQADLQNKIDNMTADILQLVGDDSVVPEILGIHDNLVAATFNAANTTDAAKIAALRGYLRTVVQDLATTDRAVRYLLREEKKRQTGVFSLTE